MNDPDFLIEKKILDKRIINISHFSSTLKSLFNQLNISFFLKKKKYKIKKS